MTLPPSSVRHKIILGQKRFAHIGTVYGMTVSPDGRILASGGYDEKVRWHCAETGELLRELDLETPWLKGLSFSGDGALFACGVTDLRVYEVEDGELISEHEGHTHDVQSIQLSSDGDLMASGSGASWIPPDHTLRLWDVDRGRVRHVLKHGGMVSEVRFSPDETEVLGMVGSVITVWDVETGEKKRAFRPLQGGGYQPLMRFSPDGRWLVCAGFGTVISVVDYQSGDVHIRLSGSNTRLSPVADVRGQIWDIRFSADGTRMWTMQTRSLQKGEGWEGLIHTWDAETFEEIGCEELPQTPKLERGVFTPDGARLFAHSENNLYLYDRDTRQMALSAPPSHSEKVEWIAFDPTGTRLVSVDHGVVKVWAIDSGALLLSTRQSSRLAWPSADGGALWTLNNDGLHRLALDTLLWTHTDSGLTKLNNIYSALFLEDRNELVLVGDEPPIRWMTLDTLETQAIPDLGDMVQINALVRSPDGTQLAIGSGTSSDGVFLVDIETRTATRLPWDPKILDINETWNGCRGMAYSPDGRQLAALSHREDIAIWDLETGALSCIPSPKPFGCYGPTDRGRLLWSPDGRTLVAAHQYDNSVRFYDAETLTLQDTIQWHTQAVHTLAFSPDGTLVASAGEDLAIGVWTMATQDVTP